MLDMNGLRLAAIGNNHERPFLVNSVEKLYSWSESHVFGGASPLPGCEIVDSGAICEVHFLVDATWPGIFEFFNRIGRNEPLVLDRR